MKSSFTHHFNVMIKTEGNGIIFIVFYNKEQMSDELSKMSTYFNCTNNVCHGHYHLVYLFPTLNIEI